MTSRLTPLQQEVLEAFFAVEDRFYLTGGAALAAFHLQHRTTHDLDLFTSESILDQGDSALRTAASRLGALIENLITAPEFRRRLVRRSQESVVVDLVRDSSFQLVPGKPRVGNIRVDPPREILANKLCALLSRAEPRDIVDVMFLERSGLRVEEVIDSARKKDTGLTPAQLAWVLQQIRIGDDARIPAGTPDEVRSFVRDICERLGRMAFPAR